MPNNGARKVAVDRKYERDVDLLLAEEIVVSPAFAKWLQNQTSFANREAEIIDVFVSRSDITGESDVVAVFEETGAAQRFALLIEDKIDAPLQPDQEYRYRLRAQREIDRGDYQAYEVILCAPSAYGVAHPQIAGFDCIISYEAIAAVLKDFDPTPRGQYRSNFIATAAMRNANTWTRVSDDVTNFFWDAAYRVATTEFPILELKPLKLTKGSTWITVRPGDLPTAPLWTYVSLKGDRGYIDLTFTGSSAAVFFEEVSTLLEPGMYIHQTGKSAAIRIEVEGFKTHEPLPVGIPKVRQAFAAAANLIAFYRNHRQWLDQAARNAVPVLDRSSPEKAMRR
jgi:hypothetical protein